MTQSPRRIDHRSLRNGAPTLQRESAEMSAFPSINPNWQQFFAATQKKRDSIVKLRSEVNNPDYSP
jgi:hypothetical protein